MGKVDTIILVFIITINVLTNAYKLPNDSKCEAGIHTEFSAAYKYWNSESETLPIREIMEQVNCLLNDFQSLQKEVFDLRRKLHRQHKHIH